MAAVLTVLVVLSLAYGAVALVAAVRVARPRHPARDTGFAPPLTVLKPLRGLDPGLADNLRSFLRQDYPAYQVLFGAADAADPAVAVARQVLAEHPAAPADLVLCPEALGPNGKASTLHQMLPFAHHDILVVSDSDTQAAPDYLRRLAASFASPRVGVVTAFYRGAAPVGLAAHLERLLIHALFVPGALVARLVEGLTFALGATLAVRRNVLDGLGGFAPFAHLLAEDYHIARRAAAGGHAVALADTAVDCMLGRMAFRDFFAHQVRWARTHRACRPAGFFGSAIRHGITLSLLLLLVAGPTPPALGLLAATLALQAAVAVAAEVAALRATDPARGLWLLPLADALGLLFWALAFTGNTVAWRGRRYRVTRGGTLVPVDRA